MASSRAAAIAARALERAWTSGLLPRPVLTPEALLAAALRGADPAALGPDQAWREPFERLLRSLRDEAALNPLGLSMAHGQIVMLLRARMRAARLWQARPGILERELAPPIVVLGQMRSGTTRVHRLLACDPRFAFTRASETLTPVPMAGRALRARAVLAALRLLNPETLRIHPTSPGAPEEEFGWLAFGFGAAQCEAQWRIPAFTRWWEAADKAALYRAFKALLRTNAWARGENPTKPWILKMPHYMEDLDALLDAFPGARLVCLERDMAKVVASSASLVWNQMRIQSDAVDAAWIGAEWLRKTRRRQRVFEEVLAARSNVPRITVRYDAIDRDWRTEMRRVYDFLGLDLPERVERRMATFLAGARRHLGHDYSLEQFGLSCEALGRPADALA